MIGRWDRVYLKPWYLQPKAKSENVRKLRNPNRPQLLDLIGRKEEEKEEKEKEEDEEDEDEEMEKEEEEEEEEEEERVEKGDAAGPFLSMVLCR
uniref:Uncharacterized protein n=1 Tax=Vespula pensylvanica TaxID=30213 RepID=A0A834N2T9_VESPE|nr:hypothetical protein H0235_016842 [Vespula pensylvanica]